MLKGYESLQAERADKAIGVSSSGANVLIPGRPSKCIICWAFDFVVAGDVSVDFEDSSGVVRAGPYPTLANGGLVRNFHPKGWFILPPGLGLNIGLGGAVAVYGGFSGGYISEDDARTLQTM